MNILITGGLGYVGGRLAHELSKSYSVFVSSRSSASQEAKAILKGVNFLNHDDLLDSKSFPEKMDVVIHLAALNEIDSVKFPDLAIEVNINQTRKILENAVSKGVSKFIYFSTIHVYGKSLTGDVDELTLPWPVHPYAITHRAAEDYVLSANESGKIQGVVVRLSNSFGAPLLPNVNRWTLLVNDICRQAVMNLEIKLNSDGKQHRDFITLTDVVGAVKLLITNKAQGVYNLSSGASMPVRVMSDLVASVSERILKKKISVVVPQNTTPQPDNHFRILPRKLELIGFKPENNFEAEVDSLVTFCASHFARNLS